MCKGIGVEKGPEYLGNGEKFDVAEIQGRWNGAGLGDETRNERSLTFLSNRWIDLLHFWKESKGKSIHEVSRRAAQESCPDGPDV